MMSVIQIAFLGLMVVNWNVGTEGLVEIKYSVGWNPLFKDMGNYSTERI